MTTTTRRGVEGEEVEGAPPAAPHKREFQCGGGGGAGIMIMGTCSWLTSSRTEDVDEEKGGPVSNVEDKSWWVGGVTLT